MKTNLGGYREHGRYYHVAVCESCGAGVQMTNKHHNKISPLQNTLKYLDLSIPCCDKPNFWWRNATQEDYTYAQS